MSDDEKPQPLGKKARLTVHKDSDHAHDVVTRRSVTGVLFVGEGRKSGNRTHP